MGTTTIRVDEEVADELARRKGRGDTYNDVIRRVLEFGQPPEPRGSSAEPTDAVDETTIPAPAAARGGEKSEREQKEESRVDVARRRVHDLDLPGGEDLQQRREAAVLDLYQELMNHPGEIVSTSELKDALEHTGGYSSVNSFWKNCVVGSGERANALASLPGVEELGNGRYQYEPPEEYSNG